MVPELESRWLIKGLKVYQIRVDDLDVSIYRKQIRHLYLKVGPSDDCVRVSAPLHIDDELIKRVVCKRKHWIRKQQKKQRLRGRKSEYQFRTGETHYVEGASVCLSVRFYEGAPSVNLVNGSTLQLNVPSGTNQEQRKEIIAQWYRHRLRSAVPKLIAAWEPIMGITVGEWRIRKMKTRWGSCNTRAGRIWISLELAKKSIKCLEYVVVHEMAHLIEPSHNRRFWGILDNLMPNWRTYRDELNRFPDAGRAN